MYAILLGCHIGNSWLRALQCSQLKISFAFTSDAKYVASRGTSSIFSIDNLEELPITICNLNKKVPGSFLRPKCCVFSSNNQSNVLGLYKGNLHWDHAILLLLHGNFKWTSLDCAYNTIWLTTSCASAAVKIGSGDYVCHVGEPYVH